ncbi:hypothetical protein AVEN_257297-1 [Araneus ventricosus]|uniref:Reverse transcriptase domain-containing protein n=1 Tax=Araneus ventricosus TaxID=182803 RepID=A0A4Y2I550_ARAVE|nr:hypothetical protein AVEN_251962-1 [Araneus ventricosus]GBM72339.1 hypothetical protein AVEN_257297-1 [Araneus ventricosus]
MTRVILGAVFSPFLSAATIKFHAKKLKSECPKTSHLLEQRLYIDDLVSCADYKEEAQKIHKDVRKILSKKDYEENNSSSCRQTISSN